MSKSGLKKICRKCGKELLAGAFYKRTSNKHDGLSSYCKQCSNYNGRINFLKRKYGISIDYYNKILKEQNYKCAICGKLQVDCKKALSVDHSHKTNYIRGLLCNYCNALLLKHLRDNKNRAEGLVKYLQKALKNDVKWE